MRKHQALATRELQHNRTKKPRLKMTTTSNSILPVSLLFKEGDEFIHKCPHCGNIRGIENETGSFSDVLQEQYEDNMCGGTYEISRDARLVKTFEEIESSHSVRDSEYEQVLEEDSEYDEYDEEE